MSGRPCLCVYGRWRWHHEDMASSKTLLSRDEVLVRHMHTHPKVLLWPGLLEVVILAGAVVLTVWMPVSWGSVPYIILWAVTLIASVPVLFLPWLRWMTTTYTVTSMRVVTRSGILRRTGHDLPMSRISDVQLDRDVVDRLFGCGTLTLQTSANDPLPLYDVPNAEMVQVEIADHLFRDGRDAADAGPRG